MPNKNIVISKIHFYNNVLKAVFLISVWFL